MWGLKFLHKEKERKDAQNCPSLLRVCCEMIKYAFEIGLADAIFRNVESFSEEEIAEKINQLKN